jgi:hypothetical protein
VTGCRVKDLPSIGDDVVNRRRRLASVVLGFEHSFNGFPRPLFVAAHDIVA